MLSFGVGAKILFRRVSAGVAFVRAGQEVLHAGNNTFESAPTKQLQGRVEPHTQEDGTFVETYLRKSRKHCSAEKGVRVEGSVRNQIASKVIEEGEGRGARSAAAEIVGVVAPEENHGGAGICQ